MGIVKNGAETKNLNSMLRAMPIQSKVKTEKKAGNQPSQKQPL